MFQGISLHSQDLHLFFDIHSLTKGIYRALHVTSSIAWELWQDIDITGVLFDREFYRAALVADLEKMHVRCLFPTKKYAWVKHHMERYLQGQGDFIVGNIFAQSNNQYPKQRAAFVWLVMIGKGNLKPWKVKTLFQHHKLTLKQALKKLKGFFTNYKPWANRKSWVSYLIRTYKRRWNIETGFSTLNKVSFTGRERSFTAKLATLVLRCTIINWWQSWRLTQIRSKVLPRDYTQIDFQEHAKLVIESIF
jgi:hypothetical protein